MYLHLQNQVEEVSVLENFGLVLLRLDEAIHDVAHFPPPTSPQQTVLPVPSVS